MTGLPYLEIIVKRRFLFWSYWQLIHRAPARDNFRELIDAYARKHVDQRGQELHWTLSNKQRIIDGGIIRPTR